jgi:hypothetical protein
MAQTTREMPVRQDGWRPTDATLEAIIKRCVEDVEAGAARDGTREYMAGAMILGLLLVGLLMAGVDAGAAIMVPLVLFGAGALYMVTRNAPAPVARKQALDVIGGPGHLPAGYLVHPGAWSAGMAEHVAYLPESQLHAAAEMARAFPGSVDDLITFTGTIAAHIPPPRRDAPADVERRARELVHVGLPILRDYHEKYPAPKPVPAGKGKKGKK